MKRLLMMSVLAGLALAACSKGDDPIAKMNSFKDQMCACKTSDCADKVQEASDKWGDDYKKNNSKPDEATMKKAEDIMDKMQDCYMNAKMGDMGGSGSGAASGSADK